MHYIAHPLVARDGATFASVSEARRFAKRGAHRLAKTKRASQAAFPPTCACAWTEPSFSSASFFAAFFTNA